MFTLFVALVVGYFVIQTAGYVVHKALHHPLLGKIHETHDIHHKQMYPPEDYLVPGEYREVPNEAQPFKYYAAAAIPLIAAAFFFLPLTMATALTAELILVAWVNDWLHQKFHIEGFWMERYTWFNELRDLHWHHHVDVRENLGIFFWLPDKILGTYSESISTPSYLIKPEPIPVIWQVDAPDRVTYIVETEVATEVDTEVLQQS